MDSNVQVADKDRPKKKKKSEVLSDVSEGVPDLHTGGKMNEWSRKKKQKDQTREDVNAQGEGEGKFKKGKTGDKIGSYRALKVLGDEVNKDFFDNQKNFDVTEADAGIVDKIGLAKGGDEFVSEEGHQKKKKKKTESNSNDGDASSAENHSPNVTIETAQRVKKKKQKKVKEDFVDPSLITELSESNGEDDRLGGDTGNEHKMKKNKKKKQQKVKEDFVDPSLITELSESNGEDDRLGGDTGNEHKMKKNKKKKQKKVKEDFVDPSLITELSGSNGEDDSLGGDTGDVHMMKKNKKKKTREEKCRDNEFSVASKFVGDVSFIENTTDHDIAEKVDPVKVLKRKKKKDSEVLGATFSHQKPVDDDHVSAVDSNGVNSSKMDETSSKSKKKGDANACTSKTVDINGRSSNDLVDDQINDEVTKEKKRNKRKDASVAGSLDEELGNTTRVASVNDSVERKGKSSKKRKGKSLDVNNDVADIGMLENNESNEAAEPSENLKSSKKSKKVKFSENVEVFPLHDASSKGKKKQLKDSSKGKEKQLEDGSKTTDDDGLMRGKRFSKEEDELVREAVLKYIEDHQLGENGVDMVMKSKSHPELKGCWKEIGEVVPYRPYTAVYYRAHLLFERSETRKWTQEEFELVKKFHEKHGPDWRTLADELGKYRFHVKDAWRRIRFTNHKKGNWSQEEYQELFNLVNMDLSMKAFSEKKTKHGMLRDNISWEAISEKLSTRSNSICCMKWYNQLVSPMVAEGLWSNTDDYRLLISLSDLDASCEEDVDWDNLLEHRSGDVCRKRWNQMVRHIGEYGTKSFIEQVDVLSQRYCRDILEARESYDNKPPVD